MTTRSVILGLVLAALICGLTFFNDMVLHGTFMVGNYMPISVFGALFVLVVVANPLLGLLSPARRFSGLELAVVVGLALVACSIPGRGLMHFFTTTLMLPHDRAASSADWKSTEVIKILPPQMLADANAKDASAFLTGIGEGNPHFGPGDVPWRQWTRTLTFWLPLLGCLSLGMIALAVVVHRQWSHHERLRYPIVTFADSLMPDQQGNVSSILRNKVFWVAALLVLAVHLVNYWALYSPNMFSIPMWIDWRPVTRLFPQFNQAGGWWLVIQPICLTAVGFAFFLSLDLSLSLGLAPYFYLTVVAIFMSRGTSIEKGAFFVVYPGAFAHAGAFFGLFLMLLFSGRRYYGSVFGRALLLPVSRETQPSAVWAARLFLIAIVGFVLQLWLAGVDWPLAILYSIEAVIIYTVISRIVAETGTFFIHPYHFPCMVLLGFLGISAIDVRSLAIMMMVSTLAFVGSREAVMPFMATALKLFESRGGQPHRLGRLAAVALLLGLAVAIPATLYIQYDKGARNVNEEWTRETVPFYALNAIAGFKKQIATTPELREQQGVTGLGRYLNAKADAPAVTAFGAALVLVLAFSALRMRFTWWPIHPVIFAVLGTMESKTLANSFLLGWLIKLIVTRLFGSRGYQGLKPIMIGLIAGDLMGGIIPMIHGAIYYLVTHTSPQSFRVLPA
ncbi:MAG: hypothetical protein LLG01_05260 [Planctomycetaceae bacterium]|nr:hypothetical protein [Planctomycetaceae bacterium]